MWFAWDGERLRITHTKTRQKFANLAEDPRLALSIADPDDGYRSLEVRGVVESVEDDDDRASFYKGLQHRYGQDYEVTDTDVRVIMTIRPRSSSPPRAAGSPPPRRPDPRTQGHCQVPSTSSSGV